jgi:hypothetical protein
LASESVRQFTVQFQPPSSASQNFIDVAYLRLAKLTHLPASPLAPARAA